MDMRTGQTYDTKAEALTAGVPESDIAEVEYPAGGEPIVKFSSGPFKNRTYKRDGRGNLVRVGK